MKIAVQCEDFDLNFELARMRESRQDIGALVSFVGLVRDLNDGESQPLGRVGCNRGASRG
jgi:molybdopterin synthase catalytic subunit